MVDGNPASGGKAAAWARYLGWNRAVAEVIYPATADPVPVYMDLEDEELASIGALAGHQGADVKEALAKAVADVTVGAGRKFSLNAISVETRLWVALNAKKPTDDAPPCLAFLALTVLAAEAMGNDDGDLASLAYYARLARLLKLPDDDAGLRAQYQGHAEYLWRCLNRWLEGLDGVRGLPTAYALNYRFVGLPMSQALVRDHDRRRFPMMFAHYGLSPGMRLAPEDLVRYLGDWLTTEGSSGTSNLRRLWNRAESHERIASIAAVELANWDGVVAGETSGATGKLAARAQVVAGLRSGFMGTSLDLSLAFRPMTADMDGAMQVRATDGEWLPLPFTPGTAGLWRTASNDSIDFASLLEGVVRISHAGDDDGTQYTHFPRMVVPLIYDELQSAFVEAERLQLGIEAMLLVRNSGTTPLAAGAVDEVEQLLSQSARPGFKKIESISGLPNGWTLFTDIQMFGAPAGTTKFNELVPMARNQLTVAGGLRIPSRIRKWSVLSPPEIRATVQSETDLRVTLVETMGDTQIAEWTSETGALIAPLDQLSLTDGDYQAALFTGKKKIPVQHVSIRLRSGDVVDAHWNDAPRLRYQLDRPLGVFSATEGEPGARFVDGLISAGPVDVEVSVSASPTIIWVEPTSVVKPPTIAIGNPDPKSCVVTGAHRIQLPPAMGGHAPKFIQGECTSCGLVKRYPGWLPRNGWKKGPKEAGQASAAVVTVGTLQEVQEHDVDWAAALDALMHLGGGPISSLESIAMQLEGSALFVDNFVRSLEALGHIAIERDSHWRPTRWEVSPTCLGKQANGAFRLAGYWPSSLRAELTACCGRDGGEVVAEAGSVNPPSLAVVGLLDDGAMQLATELDSGVSVAPEAGAAILHTLPTLSSIAAALPRSAMPGFQSAERFDLASAGWRPTGDTFLSGAYRVRRGFETTYLYRSESDVDAGTAAIAPVHLVKHLAANDHGKSLMSYHEKDQTIVVPQGCDLPGLYGRAAVALSGHLPLLRKVTVRESKRNCLLYDGIDRSSADLFATLLST